MGRFEVEANPSRLHISEKRQLAGPEYAMAVCLRVMRATLLLLWCVAGCHARTDSSDVRIGRILHQATTARQTTPATAAATATAAAVAGAHGSNNQQRQLLEGLECNLQIYESFIDSEEGQDTFIMATMCESRIVYIKNVRAGLYGPVEQADLRSAMCSDECVKSDTLHQLALSRSRCSCAQVSATTFVVHDFCRENSARLLCTHLGECGHWGCELEDFMCMRYEWDRLYACSSSALVVNTALLVVCFVVLQLVM